MYISAFRKNICILLLFCFSISFFAKVFSFDGVTVSREELCANATQSFSQIGLNRLYHWKDHPPVEQKARPGRQPRASSPIRDGELQYALYERIFRGRLPWILLLSGDNLQ